MSTEFKPKDRVSINKDLAYTAPRFGAVSEMRKIFTGTVTRNPFQDDDEVIVMLDYPDNVPESKRFSYSYDPRDLTLISRSSESKPLHFKLKDRVKVNSLKHTRERFGIVEKMSEILTGTVDYVDESLNEVQLKLDGDDDDVYLYDPKDLTLIPNEPKPKRKKGKPILDGSNNFPTPTNVKTSSNKTTVEFSDNTTTSVTKSAGDPYDLETAIAYCIAKKLVTNSCIKHLAKNAEEVNDKVDVDFYNKFLKPYGFKNGGAYFDVEIETLKNYLKTLNDVRADLALIAIENDLTKDELLNKLKG